ncbi:Panacea domain-containing protein [Mesorhizobium australafricanum]|uniref:DUF4065 domain-containing protein n=1 Tax=Mesorhizobium australafricanum TaxID=3072311 RepID=A0ABU4X2B0_9HYPH|nr:type II toxin-antitoxin system antitoxin SocA domain-containing protein [Mesorhizobium sp. VK3E]MDX8441876.1 DUF4065 domain-containing protein [Mesorhizobium sp. VK3E]
MPHDARAIANFLLDRAQQQGIKLTHLSLQKILYFAHAWYLAKYDRPLLGQKFEAWKFGPVIRVVFDQLKSQKDRIIEERLLKIDVVSGKMAEATCDISSEDQKFIDSIFSYYASFDAGKLVDLTHEKGGPWEKVWKSAAERSVVGMYIPDESIRLWILREGGREGLIRH